MTLEIKSERRNLTFGSGEPAITHEKAVEIVKEYARLMDIAEMSRHVCTACEYEYNGSCDLHRSPGRCHNATAVAEANYNAGYRKQSGWISVEERMPEQTVLVLGFCHTQGDDEGFNDRILVMELNRLGQFMPFNCSPIKDNSVTHWMPLPGAPKMRGGEFE